MILWFTFFDSDPFSTIELLIYFFLYQQNLLDLSNLSASKWKETIIATDANGSLFTCGEVGMPLLQFWLMNIIYSNVKLVKIM